MLKYLIRGRLFKNVQMQGAQKLRNEAYIKVRRLTKLAAQRSRLRPRESVGWAFFNSLLEEVDFHGPYRACGHTEFTAVAFLDIEDDFHGLLIE